MKHLITRMLLGLVMIIFAIITYRPYWHILKPSLMNVGENLFVVLFILSLPFMLLIEAVFNLF